ncbi:uncharacterized protein [Physcomitrium patens]|uniref:Protein kinase domain-containing protein n=1 Tax=Physcomitrium patens TaxID=3218 RepID=A0A2K1IQ53_PHYPA|nr:uncharacterized protein LOC112274040 isoform X1 [Physcomitrium patens]XP_024358946.1 uncharacterized protein LOC112274040 isoform X1 [Physcomitrium patens]XP_024358947.1 uncharacterized protein LOC112274040 isoform X1 [Physcomitrium patens]XP_024358949.1 uncharacterized protein LOC112274040 isoform X1 [Physcomitrium patens]XP_024358950.1 uncharacterized protein LOC112274040 isoform X1 [Physcomitrium patens]PNR31414.1 hypothetical protein PHYPA_025535 [Physcomitrium patens]|eukprot:XP_024358945.1 uncharacterized protein LOC112274040 isoform X1 [Physcomitrella patens]
MERFRTYFRRFSPKAVPKADELLNICTETIQKLSSSTEVGTEDYLMNRHQCNFLVGRLSDTRDSLQKILISPLLDEKTILALEELHQVLLDVETVINASRITSSQWPRAAIEQWEMKETFSRLLYDVQWYTSVLLSILVDNSQESYITFEPALCGGQLSVGDEFSLLTAMKEDEESLKDRLRSVKVDDPIEKWLANQLLKQTMRSEEDHLNASHQFLKNSEGKDSESSLFVDDSNDFSLATASPGILFLKYQDLNFDGIQLGKGASATVRRTKLIGGQYAMKTFETGNTTEFDQEIAALQILGQHPHVVRLLCYSKEDDQCVLIMEEMHKDLSTVLSDISRYRKQKGLTPTRPFSDVQAVALMLQIGEGMKYIHSKGIAHRDLKSLNVLVNLADPSSRPFSKIRSVKIADFGLAKTKNASQTYSNQTVNRGTNKWMAPEVIEFGDKKRSRFNPRKADVYSFAIICWEILTGKLPYFDIYQTDRLIKDQVKAGTLRPNLSKECPPKLAALIKRCWHPISHERPLFPEICKELRYIKGLLLRGDQRTLELQDSPPLRSLGRAQIQGPWGGAGGGKFLDMGTSINRIKFKYSQSPGLVGLMEVEYNFDGKNYVRRYCDGYNGHQEKEIVFEPFEFITHISGCKSQTALHVSGIDSQVVNVDSVVSLTIHTNIKNYGPFGHEKGEPFTSAIGRVIGFHGGGGAILDSLGVVIILGDTS